MNKIFVLTVALFCLVVASKAQERIITESQLPIEIQNYLKQYFPKNKVLRAEEDKEYFSTSYEIKLQNGIELDFEGTKIKEIEANTKLPDSVIPKKIRDYVATNYPDFYIIGWELNDLGNRQQIKLNNEMELEFNKKGRFVRFDD